MCHKSEWPAKLLVDTRYEEWDAGVVLLDLLKYSQIRSTYFLLKQLHILRINYLPRSVFL